MTKNNRAGYTIVELMIVLAVTAATGVAAFTVVKGQTGKQEFTQGVRDFETRLTDIANDVAKGYYPNIGEQRQCYVTTPTGPIDFAPPGGATKEQGASEDCVFAGKVIEFEADGDPSKIDVLTMAARRRSRSGKDVTGLSSLQNQDIRVKPDVSETASLPHGLQVQWVRANGESAGSIAFLSGFGNRSTANSNLTGAPETDLYWMDNTSFGMADTALRGALETISNYREPDNNGITICVDQGGGTPSARLRLGQDGRRLTTTVTIEPNATC